MDSSVSKMGSNSIGTVLPPSVRYLYAAVIVLLLLSLIGGALAIPFFFESPSMWYRFGWDKLSLRTGKLLGITAGLLILIQLPLAGRLRILDRIFSMPVLIRRHKIHARVIVAIALIHPVCVLLPDRRIIIPLEMRYWPEWIGVGLLAILLIQFVSSQWRQSLGIAFHRWLQFHRIIGPLIATLMVIHVLYVSESFSVAGLPRWSLFVAAGIYLLIWIWVRTGWMRARNRPYMVSRIEAVESEFTSVELSPVKPAHFSYVPGQFIFVSFDSSHVSKEAHPFTLASTPSRPDTLQLIIRACGDWTRTVGHLSKGDRAYIQGPFGRFGHLYFPPHRELIMIAGGIGITPMLSMLRFMVDCREARPTTLIWSNRSAALMEFGHEIELLARDLPELRWIPIITGNRENGKRSERLNRASLENMLSENSRESVVFLCGPPQMMAQLELALRAIGFPAGSIHTEVFGF
jgi:predicted ferric reductase